MISVTNLARNLTETTRAHAGRVAVRVDDAALTYRALDEASARVAGLLRERGLEPGDRVGLMMPNVAEVPVVYYGVLRAGGVVVPMNPLLKGREVAYYLSDSGAGLLFAWHAFALFVSWMIVVVAPIDWKIIVVALWLLYGLFLFSLIRDVVSQRRRHSRGTK